MLGRVVTPDSGRELRELGLSKPSRRYSATFAQFVAKIRFDRSRAWIRVTTRPCTLVLSAPGAVGGGAYNDGCAVIAAAVMLSLLYAPTLYFSTAALIAIAVYALRRTDVPGSPTYAGVLLAAAWWTLVAALETEFQSIEVKLGLRHAAWLSILSINVLNLRFLAFYLRGDPGLARRLSTLWIVPVLAWVALVTNDRHGLFYTGYRLVAPPGITALDPGPLLMLASGYTLLLGAIGIAWLLQATRRAQGNERRRDLLLLAAVLAPIPFIAAYWLQWVPIDLTPISFILVAFFVGQAIYRYRLFSLLPIAQEMILRDLNDGFILLDARHQVVVANPAWARLFGGQAPARGQAASDVFQAQVGLWPALTTVPEPIEIELTGDHARIVELQAAPVLDDDGARQGHLVLARDITQRKAAAAHIADQAKNLAVTAARRRFDQELKDALAQVLRYVRGQITLAGDLIARGDVATASALLARLDAIAADADSDVLGTITQDGDGPAQVDFYQALRQYAREFGQVSGIYVALSLPEVPASVHLLPIVQAQVMRIIQEVLNQIREQGQSRTAQIIFARQGAEVQVTLAADGHGLTLPLNAEAQDRFNSLRERVAAIGGRMQLETGLGQGTTLRIHLAVATPEAGPGPLAGLRVVLADPQALVLEGVRQILSAHGVDVVGEARDGATAAHLCAVRHPDLALLDLRLDRLSGPEAATEIARANPEVRCVILADSTADAEVTRALQSGVAGYLLKGQGLSDFIEALVRLRQGERVYVPEVALRMASLVAAGPEPAEDLTARLTVQQAEILRMVAEGLTYKEVGARKHITERTVRYHMEQILDALGLASRSKAIAFAYRVGLARDRRRAPRPAAGERDGALRS